AIEVESLERYLRNIVDGQYSFEQRMMLEAYVKREDKVLARYRALNDIVVSRGPFSRIIRLDTYIDGNFLESYLGDGVIVASPTGSTGYSLSAGGPIVNPELELLVVTPICPHSLSNRAVIATSKEKVSMKVNSRQSPVVMTVDGQEGFSLEDSDQVVVFKGSENVRLVTFAGHSFYKILHQKLKG
ncbi:MAG TPA: NAD(+)/NADH kinase, partial [Firmicutes bacterium]|nr:NAD(+)/NADH kinase [Bacillota bacterium]